MSKALCQCGGHFRLSKRQLIDQCGCRGYLQIAWYLRAVTSNVSQNIHCLLLHSYLLMLYRRYDCNVLLWYLDILLEYIINHPHLSFHYPTPLIKIPSLTIMPPNDLTGLFSSNIWLQYAALISRYMIAICYQPSPLIFSLSNPSDLIKIPSFTIMPPNDLTGFFSSNIWLQYAPYQW